jgi:hypothetical protein
MTWATADEQVRDYLDALRTQLGDLDPEEREHLLSDTEASLLEAPEDDLGVPPEVRLGPPEHFARELRAAAGLPETPARASRESLLTRVAAHPAVASGRRLAGDLAPVWWVLRAFVALTVIAQLFGDDWSFRYPIFTAVLGDPLGWILLAGAVAGSVALGRRPRLPRRWARTLDAVAGAAAVWLALVMIAHAGQGPPMVFVEPELPQGLTYNGRTLGNVYPYDRQGRLLQDVRLFDDDGRPLDVRRGERQRRRVVTDGAGERLYNSFPIRYYERGRHRVRRPRAGGLDRPPARIATPPVTARSR